ncbi:MAG: glutaredoxin 3 [Desulfuromonas sp.]|nr:MAG: glutaredoxin 3 [Desulfuromonas sp.]
MKKIEIYTKDYCPYCHRAKELLRTKEVEFIEYDVTNDLNRENEMRDRCSQRTVPQTFVDNQHLGGCDDLFDLESEGKLDKALGL